jgi:O-antigen/teichoic acid export membrane protein
MTDALDELAAVPKGTRGSGFVPVALGVGVFGAAAYGFLGIAGQAMGPELFAPLSVLWTMLNVLSGGLFLPFEQELGRTTASRRALGLGNLPVVRVVLRVGVALLSLVAVGALVMAPQLASQLWGGRRAIVLLLVLAVAGIGLSFAVRGLLAGNGRFGRYGAQLAVDGVLRVGAAAVLAASGVRDPVAYGLVLVVAPVLAVLLTTPWRPTDLVAPGPPVVQAEVVRAMAVLLLASLTAQLLANAGPLIVQVRATPAEEVFAGQFVAALVVARIPLFLFTAVQAVLLPGLSELVGAGDAAGFLRRFARVAGLTAGVAAATVLIMWLWGGALVRLLFGTGFGVSQDVLVLIALSSALSLLAQVCAQADLALGGEAWVLAGWTVGVVVLVATCLVQGPVTWVAAMALVTGAGAALTWLAATLVVHVLRFRHRAAGT